jgi:hypothetical protein
MVIQASQILSFIHPQREKIDVRKSNGDHAFTANIAQIITLGQGKAIVGVIHERKSFLRYVQLIVPEIRARKLAGIASGSKSMEPLPRAEDSKTSFRAGATYMLHMPHCAAFGPLVENARTGHLELDPILA